MRATNHFLRLQPRLVACAALLCLAQAHAVVTVTGDYNTNGLPVGPGDTNLGLTQMYLGFANPGALLVDGGSQFLAGGLTFSGGTSTGTGTIIGAGTLVNLLGTGNRVEVGNSGVGSLTVSGGASLQARNDATACGACFNFISNSAGSSGTFTVTGAGSSASLWAMVVGHAAVFGAPNPFGTPGGLSRGAVNVLDGGYLESVANTISSGPTGPNPNGAERTFGTVLVSGTGSTWHVTSNLVNGIDANVTMSSHLNATSEMEVSNGGLLLLDAVPGRFTSLAIGQRGRADMVVASGGQVVYGAGASGLLQIGRNAGAQGSLQVLSGGQVSGGIYYSSVGRDGGTGALTIDGAGSLVRLDGDTTIPASGGAASFVASMDIGRNGGTGRLVVNNGGRLEIAATTARSTSPALNIGRDAGAIGMANLNGGGTVVQLTAASVVAGGGSAEARNPRVVVGALGTGTMNITAGAKLLMDGGAVSTVAAQRSTALFVGGTGDTGSGGTGVLNLTGLGSQVVMTGSDAFVGVGIGAGATGVLNTFGQGELVGTIVNVGRSGGMGAASLDNGTWRLSGQHTGGNQSGAGVAVGSGNGVGTLAMRNGALIQVTNAGSAGGGMTIGGSSAFAGGMGTVTMDGNSRIEVQTTNLASGVTVGRDGIGSLSLSASHIDVGATGAVVVGRSAGGVGTLVLTNSSTVTADYVGVGRNRNSLGELLPGGVGTLVVNSGSTVTANLVEIGTAGYLGGNGTVAGTVVNYGTVNPGNSPGTLVIDGSFINTAVGRVVLEVEADGNGGFVTDQLIFTSTADLAGSLVTFSFLGATDPTAFQASGLFTLDTFLKQRTSAGDVALAPASFAGVTYAAESETYTFSNFSFTPTGGAVFAVPEPATWASLAAGLLLLAGLRRRREA